MTAWLDRVHEVVAQFHRANPLLRGISKQELRSRELPDAPAFLMDEVLAHSKTLATEGDLLRLVSHKLQFKQDEESAVNRIVGAFEKAGLAVPAWKDVLASCGVEPARSRSLLQILLKDGRLVRVSEDLLFHRSAIQDLRSLLARRKGQSFGVSEFKDWTGASRKYAIPLLEYLDRERVTRRDGDSRVVL
jgi:selenocysteine-specific elongation factor